MIGRLRAAVRRALLAACALLLPAVALAAFAAYADAAAHAPTFHAERLAALAAFYGPLLALAAAPLAGALWGRRKARHEAWLSAPEPGGAEAAPGRGVVEHPPPPAAPPPAAPVPAAPPGAARHAPAGTIPASLAAPPPALRGAV